MKKHLAKSYPELPKGWTIVRGHNKAFPFYGLNTRTGFKTVTHTTYDFALKDVQRYSGYAEPWGV